MEERIKEIIYFNKKGILTVLLTLLVIGGSIFAFIITTPKDKVEAKEEIEVVEEKKEEVIKEKDQIVECYFDIKGKVKKEGVYKIDCNKRIIDAIKLAGGTTKDADTSIINLSKKITDSMVIKVYSKTEVKNYLKTLELDKKKQELCQTDTVKNDACIEEIKKDNSTTSNLININTATIEQLMTLPGVGESRAKAIIEYREKNPFKTIEDIKNVSGIGESMYVKIKENITV